MKKFVSFILSLIIAISFSLTAFAASGETASLQIRHIYGGGGKDETPISNDFIELYNSGENAVDLSEYSIKYDDETLALSGSISAKGSYLIVGAANNTTDEFITYDLPAADKTCDFVIDNKKYTIALLKGETEVDSVTATGSGDTKISKQKSLKKTESGFQLIVWEKATVTVDDAYVTANAPRNSKGQFGGVHGANTEPSYTSVVTSNVRVNGYFNDKASLNMTLDGRYNSGAMNADGGSLEIVDYNSSNGYAYAVSGVKGKLIAVNLNAEMNGETVENLSGTEYDVKSLISGFAYGDITSVAVSPSGKYLAVAVQAENYAEKGVVALFSCRSDGSLEMVSYAQTGVQPDMVTFADENTLLTADEGEPRQGINGTDPKGSVTIAVIGEGGALTSKQVYFDKFDSKRDELTASGVLVQKGIDPSTDFEPEYIAVSGDKAYISLQEANAIAELNISAGEFVGVYPLGFQDYSVTEIDLQKNDNIELKNYPDVYGIKMPDGISVTQIDGKTYILTANEGDSRADWAGMDNEYENKTSPSGNVTLEEKTVWFNANMWDGLDTDKAYVFGGRSFSIYEATNNGLTLVYDSGSDFEKITAEVLPDYFNASNDKITLDNRSGKKGPEPESVTVGTICNKTYAFTALERIGGIMVYDITDINDVKFVNYINSREFEDKIQGDVSPEGLCVVSADDSKTGKPLLLAACEVSGTLAVYGCNSTEHKFDAESATEKYLVSEATCTGKAVYYKSCSICGAAGTETFESGKLKAHDYDDDTDAFCNVCGYIRKIKDFADVAQNDWYSEAVNYAVGAGIMTGYQSNGLFGTSDGIQRQDFILMLARYAGADLDAYANTANKFSDVDNNGYYAAAVKWGEYYGIITGYTAGDKAGCFGVGDTITREQLVTMLYRYAENVLGKDVTVSDDAETNAAEKFNDCSKVSVFSTDAVLWATEKGVINGKGENHDAIDPQGNAQRCEVAQIMYNIFKNNIL